MPQDRTVISKRSTPVEPRVLPKVGGPMELGRSLEGHQLGHFLLEKFVGGGGMGAVFRATDTKLSRIVAVKVMARDRTDDDTLRRFQNEAQSAARLDHPNIARVHYVGEDEGLNYIVFEYIEGTNIRDLVVARGPLPLEEAINYTLQVAEALEHAHQRDVVHRDIKPSNVLVMDNGHVKLVDMGLARMHQVEASNADLTATGVTLGTFDYISPEQARDPRSADVRSDLYSLGCTLYYMLTGRPPFPDGTVLQKLLSHSSDAPPDVRAYRPELSEDVSLVVQRLLAKQPNQRYQTPSELIGALLLLADGLGFDRLARSGAVWVAPQTNAWSVLERQIPWAAPTLLFVLLIILLRWGWNSTSDRYARPTRPSYGSPVAIAYSPDDSSSSTAPARPDGQAAEGTRRRSGEPTRAIRSKDDDGATAPSGEDETNRPRDAASPAATDDSVAPERSEMPRNREGGERSSRSLELPVAPASERSEAGDAGASKTSEPQRAPGPGAQPVGVQPAGVQPANAQPAGAPSAGNLPTAALPAAEAAAREAAQDAVAGGSPSDSTKIEKANPAAAASALPSAGPTPSGGSAGGSPSASAVESPAAGGTTPAEAAANLPNSGGSNSGSPNSGSPNPSSPSPGPAPNGPASNGPGGAVPSMAVDSTPAAASMIRRLVVGEPRVDDEGDELAEAPDARRFDSLHEAFRAAVEFPGVDAIELRYDGPRVSRPFDVSLPSRRVAVRAAVGRRPAVVFQPNAAEPTLDRRMIRLLRTSLLWDGVPIQLDLPDAPSDDWSLFYLDRPGRVELTGVTATIRERDAARRLAQGVAFFRFAEPIATETMMDMRTTRESSPTSIQLQQCVVRGPGSLIRATTGVAFRLSWQQGLFASTAGLWETQGARVLPQPSEVVSFDLSHVTLAVGRPLCQMRLEPETRFPLEFVGKFQDCIFMTSANGMNEGTGLTLFEQQFGAGVDSARYRPYLSGSGNYYPDDAVLLRISPIGNPGTAQQYTLRNRHEARQEKWYDEQPSPGMVMWRQLPARDLPVEKQTKSDYQLDDAVDNPASRAGFDPEQLPD